MDILIIHLGGIADNIVATSIIRSVYLQYESPKIYWIVKDESCKNIFKFNKQIYKVISIEEFMSMNNKWDVFINLHPGFSKEDCDKISSDKKIGFFNSDDNDDLYVLYSMDKSTSMSSVQIYHRLIGKKWEGTGYDIGYYPKTKSNKKKSGIFISNTNLKHYCLSSLYKDDKNNNLWIIPFKNSLFKKMDEINKCGSIVTDDLVTMHLSIYLRKYVYFLETLPQSTRYEFFGKGQIYSAPLSIIR